MLTSSIVAVCDVSAQLPVSFDESDWNDASVEAVNTKGIEAGPLAIYQASKTLAEKAAWDFVAAHKSEISWDLVALNPVWIFGVQPFVFTALSPQLKVLRLLTAIAQSRIDG